MLKKIFYYFIVINLLLLDGVSIFLLINSKNNKSSADVRYIPEGTDGNLKNNDYCDENCQNTILSEIEGIRKSLSGIKTIPTTLPTKPLPSQAVYTRTKTKSVLYVPIPGSGSTLNTSWTNLIGTDFYMNKSDYSGIKNIYFEANMKLFNGNGMAYLRVFDVTHGIGVNGSEISTSSQSSTFVVSGNMSLWEGYNHYIIQARSLTSDTTVFESGRIRIVTEN